MNDIEKLLSFVGSLDPDVGENSLTFTLLREGTTVHLTPLGDPLLTTLLEAVGRSATCSIVDGNIEILNTNQIREFEVCVRCIGTTSSLVMAISDDDLRYGCSRLLAIPVLREPLSVIDTLTEQTSTHKKPASALVSRYASLRAFLSTRLGDDFDDISTRYVDVLANHAEKATASMEELHRLLFSDGKLEEMVLEEHGVTVEQKVAGNCLAELEPIDPGSLLGNLDDQEPPMLTMTEMIQIIHVPQSLGADAATAALLPCTVADVLSGPHGRGIQSVGQGLADDVLGTALSLHEPTIPTSIYHSLDRCVEAARLIHR
jgi:hypothetical protein